MALTEDQRAMLQLLLERGQSYEDIASLLGSDVDGIRSRARDALREMGGADPDADVSLTDFLLGQADPIGRADAARHLQGDADARELANKLEAQLRLIAPGADLPEIPSGGKPAPSRFAPAAKGDKKPGAASQAEPKPKATSAAASSSSGISGQQKRLIGALVGAAVVVLAIVLIATGAFSGGGGDDNGSVDTTASGSGDPTSQTASNTTGAQAGDPNVVSALLKPVGEADPKAKGGAVFGQIKNTPVLQIIAKGLEPTTDGENYSIWLYRSDKAAFRLSGVRVTKTGGIAAQIPIPRQVLRFVSNGTFPQIDISLTQDADLKAQAAKDRQTKKLTLNHIGESVLRGEIKGPGIGDSSAGG